MNLQILSDVHLEFMTAKSEEEFFTSLDPDGVDVLVLAGDIVPIRFFDQVRDSLGRFCEIYPHVVYVPGNHDYYKSRPTDVHALLGAFSNECANFHWLKSDSPVTIEGQRFVGGTLWFPQTTTTYLMAPQLNDFRLIREFTPWVFHENKKFRHDLWDVMKSTDVVVTHHLPSFSSVALRYQHEGLGGMNQFFVSDEAKLISHANPKLWIHGHTHEACDYILGDTRVICNPKGYPQENKPFQEKLIITV